MLTFFPMFFWLNFNPTNHSSITPLSLNLNLSLPLPTYTYLYTHAHARTRTRTHSVHQAGKLVEAGFEYVTELDGVKMFRMKK